MPIIIIILVIVFWAPLSAFFIGLLQALAIAFILLVPNSAPDSHNDNNKTTVEIRCGNEQ